MGCNTSQEQKNAVADSGEDVNDETAQQNDSNARAKSGKSAKSEKLTNGHADNNGSESKEEDKAATKIQAVFRGHKVRASMKKGDSSTAAKAPTSATSNTSNCEPEPTKEELEAEFREDDKELQNAATRIQAAFRGHLTRKVATKGEPDDAELQEITKKVAEELDIDLNDPELNKAATKIQASFRGHKERARKDDK